METDLAEQIARRAHTGQTDKAGVDYIHHPAAVAHALAGIAPHLEAAGWLHDVVEDSDWTAQDLTDAGISEHVTDIVNTLTRRADETYSQFVIRVCHDPDAATVKLADNLHNSHPSRPRLTGEGTGSLASRYVKARAMLMQVVPAATVRTICERLDYPTDLL